MKDKRFIEISFPIKEISEISSKEKNIRHGHISTLHIWWARRPLASSRATSYAALIPAPESLDEWEKKRQFIIELSKWENSLNYQLIEKARREILEANGDKPPRILDPFAGGGSIPLEALRLGCETHAIEYNPVAVLILKCTLEYPHKYGERLLKDVKKWGQWVLEEAKKEIGRFYPSDKKITKTLFGNVTEEEIPIGYIWARTIPCQNPACNAEIPLMRQFWLSKKEKKKIALYPYVEGKKVKFKIVGDGYEKMLTDFDPSKGTVSRAVVVCPVCGSTIDANTTRKLFQEGKAGQRMIAVILYNPKEKGKKYRLATEKDIDIYKSAEKYLKEKMSKLLEEWGMDPVPDEPLPPKETLGFRVQRYGILKWGDLFNSRQKLALIIFTEKVRYAYKKMIKEGYDKEYAKAVASYLGLAMDMMAAFTNTLARWENTTEAIKQLYSRQALPIIWDYTEVNPFSGSSGSWTAGWEYYIKVIEHCYRSTLKTYFLKVVQGSATEIQYPDNYFDAVFTDPPYYDNVPYSYLSDFFYVWLKRSIGDLYPELFTTPLTPKSKEIVAYSHREGGFEAGKRYFEEMLKKAFKEIARVLKPNGIATIVYTHKSTSGWETLINSLLDSGLVPTASWPIDTEMKARLRAKESAALASSIYFVCRKMKRKEIGWLNEVKEEIKKYVKEKLERLWKEGISGSDYFVSAIGSAVEIFGKYKKVIDYEGNIVRANKLLEYIRELVTDYAVRQILHDGAVGELSPLTRFYILWRWTYGEARVHFDEARKLAQSVGIDLVREWNRGFIRKEKEFIRVLGPHERDIDEIRSSKELIDVLHKTLLLWKSGKKEEMKKLLIEMGYGVKESFYRVAQAISETLPIESKEKKMLDGFLSEKEKLKSEIKRGGGQRRLFK